MNIENNHKKINILFIIDTLCGAGGTENHLYYLVKYLNRDKFNCSIVSFNVEESFVNKFNEIGVKVYHVPVARYYTVNALKKSFMLRKIIKDNMIDIVQTFHIKSDTYGVINARLAGVEYVISSRRDTGDTKKKIHMVLNKICNHLIDKFITVCDAVGERVAADEGVPVSKLETIYNGVDLEKYIVLSDELNVDMREKIGLGKNDPVIGSVAHFRPEKNYAVFFRALLDAKNDVPDLKAVVVGQGPELEYFKAYCEKHGISDDVIFTGPVEDVRKYIAVMDVACLVPGSNEGFSNAILEEMAMGKPVIATSVGGNAESVEDGVNGIIIPPLEHTKLADAIRYLFKDPDKRAEMGRKSRARVEKLFSIERMIENHEKLYEEVAGKATIDSLK